MRSLLGSGLALLLAGCSFFTMRGGRSCTRTPIPPIVDTAATVVLAALAIREAAGRDCGPDGCHTFDETPLYAVPAVVFGVAATYGFARMVACRRSCTTPCTAAGGAAP